MFGYRVEGDFEVMHCRCTRDFTPFDVLDKLLGTGAVVLVRVPCQANHQLHDATTPRILPLCQRMWQ